MSGDAARAKGIKPLARVVASGQGMEAETMPAIGPTV